MKRGRFPQLTLLGELKRYWFKLMVKKHLAILFKAIKLSKNLKVKSIIEFGERREEGRKGSALNFQCF